MKDSLVRHEKGGFYSAVDPRQPWQSLQKGKLHFAYCTETLTIYKDLRPGASCLHDF